MNINTHIYKKQYENFSLKEGVQIYNLLQSF